MAEQKIDLKKVVHSKKRYNELNQKSFSEIGKSKEPINPEKVVDVYNEAFYDISKTGDLSHEEIVIRSEDYVYPERNIALENQIDILNTQIEQKNEELLNLLTPSDEHPFYPDKTFLIAGQNGEKIQGMDTIYIMQKGLKRPIHGDMWVKLRKILGQPYEGEFKYSGKLFLSVDELNSIDDGKPINTDADLSLLDITTTQTTIYERRGYYVAVVHCLGMEPENLYGLTYSNYYLTQNDEKCIVKYHYDELIGDPVGGSTKTMEIPAGEYREIEFLRETEHLPSHNILYPDYTYPNDNLAPVPTYSYISTGSNYGGTDMSNVVTNTPTVVSPRLLRIWGKDRKYDAILYVKGRMQIKEKKPNNEGVYKLLNGVAVDSLPETVSFNQKSDYNTRMIYEFPNQWGSFGQDSWLRDKFMDPSFWYYRSSRQVLASSTDDTCKNRFCLIYKNTYRIYGQPILKWSDGDYVIYLDMRHPGYISDKQYFWSLKRHKIIKKYNGDTYDEFGFGIDRYGTDTGGDGVTWDTIKRSKVVYPGLRYPTSGQDGVVTGRTKSPPYYFTDGLHYGTYEDNFWNPKDGGSNYGWTNEMLKRMDSNYRVEKLIGQDGNVYSQIDGSVSIGGGIDINQANCSETFYCHDIQDMYVNGNGLPSGCTSFHAVDANPITGCN